MYTCLCVHVFRYYYQTYSTKAYRHDDRARMHNECHKPRRTHTSHITLVLYIRAYAHGVATRHTDEHCLRCCEYTKVSVVVVVVVCASSKVSGPNVNCFISHSTASIMVCIIRMTRVRCVLYSIIW